MEIPHLYFSCSGPGSIWAAGSSGFPRVRCCVNEPQSSENYSHPDKSEQSQRGRVRKAKISPLQGEIKRHIKA